MSIFFRAKTWIIRKPKSLIFVLVFNAPEIQKPGFPPSREWRYHGCTIVLEIKLLCEPSIMRNEKQTSIAQGTWIPHPRESGDPVFFSLWEKVSIRVEKKSGQTASVTTSQINLSLVFPYHPCIFTRLNDSCSPSPKTSPTFIGMRVNKKILRSELWTHRTFVTCCHTIGYTIMRSSAESYVCSRRIYSSWVPIQTHKKSSPSSTAKPL